METFVIISVSALILGAVAFCAGWACANMRYKKHNVVVEKPSYFTDDKMSALLKDQIEVHIITECLADYSEDNGFKTKSFTFYTKAE